MYGLYTCDINYKGYPPKPLAFPNVFCRGVEKRHETDKHIAVCGECGNFVTQLAERRQSTSQLWVLLYKVCTQRHSDVYSNPRRKARP